ncbi:peroxide stress protein YaaA [Sinomonas sp. JGH33]|uniref:Peroxide stress protein YaaA n=1 Tax=Sinomonas terricola TaxID=3110330 RepID=A0ABU5T9Y2_9MICC|nr:peroxide stress protein YaaA [Sinomonas sp. JGH33]MEA5456498.1 peroxide stress protein YaaA [Sinomonas sp. JGH33]
MLILLPPSEGKTPASRGAAVDLSALSFPGLEVARKEVMEALAEVSGRHDALEALGVGASLADDVERNRRLHAEPAAPAHRVYSGVLYEALGYASLTPAQRRKADEWIVVVSALWGAVGFADAVPAYRLSMSAALPGLGRLASYWKPRLREALSERAADGLVVDCRSSTYAAAYAPPADRTVTVDVVTERNGKRTVVSHFAKHHRGEFVRHLLTRRGKAPTSPEALLAVAQEGWTAELAEGTARRPSSLVLVLEG